MRESGAGIVRYPDSFTVGTARDHRIVHPAQGVPVNRCRAAVIGEKARYAAHMLWSAC